MALCGIAITYPFFNSHKLFAFYAISLAMGFSQHFVHIQGLFRKAILEDPRVPAWREAWLYLSCMKQEAEENCVCDGEEVETMRELLTELRKNEFP